MTRLAGLMLILSGISSLIYIVVWVRLLNVTVSASTTATTLVLCVILGGLAFGSLLAKWRLNSGKNTLKGFSLAQIITAISALIMLPILLSSNLVTTWLPNQQVESVYGFIALLLLLMIPTTASGMGLALFANWFIERKQQSKQTYLAISQLFTLFILGAATGVLLSAFYLTPSFGLDGAIYFAAALNLFTALLATKIDTESKKLTKAKQAVTSASPIDSQARTAVQPSSELSTSQSVILLGVLAISSFVLMSSGIIWTQYLAIYTGTTLYGYSAILFAILVGLILGAFLVQQWQLKKQPNFKSFFWLLTSLFAALNLTSYLLGSLPYLYDESYYLGELLSSKYALLMGLILLPSSVLFGAIFALGLSLYGASAKAVKNSFGSAFAIKLIAAIGAVICTKSWLIPEFGSSDSLLILSIPILIAALITVLKSNSQKSHLAKYGLILTLGATSLFIPGIHLKTVFDQHHYRYIDSASPKKYYHLSESPSGSIGLTEYGTELVHLQINGLSQSFVHYRHPYKSTVTGSLAGALPYLLQENVENALVIGFGVGTTTRILANSELDGIIKVVEPEAKIVEAMRLIGQRHFAFFEDGRVELDHNDPRISLIKDTERYSIIASQPASPWLYGSNNYYSQEFFELVKSRLKEDGIFAHAFSLFRIDSELFKSILNTFYSVFPQGAVFGDLSTGELVLLGGNQSMVLDYQRSLAYFEIEEAVMMLRYGGLRNVPELPNYYIFSSEQALAAAKDAEIIRDTNLLVEADIPILSETLPKGSDDPYQLLKQYSKERFTKIQ